MGVFRLPPKWEELPKQLWRRTSFPSRKLLKLLEKIIFYCQRVKFGHESLHTLISKTTEGLRYSCLLLNIQLFASISYSSGTLAKIMAACDNEFLGYDVVQSIPYSCYALGLAGSLISFV